MLNTDAEGRLILADGLVRAGEDNPDLIVDIATLTGACVIALGTRVSGIMANDDRPSAIRCTRCPSGLASRCGRFPFPVNCGRSSTHRSPTSPTSGAKWGGALAAGVFLQEFVRDGLDWVHLDIAGPAFNDDRPTATPRRAAPVSASGRWCRSSRTWRAARCRSGRVRVTRGIALVRRPSDRLAEGIVTHVQRRPVDLTLARRQHEAYRDALAAAGWTVREVEPAPEHPDSVFVEDTVVVFEGLAVLTRPGAAERRAEVDGTEAVVRDLGLEVVRIAAPGTLDGGDVLQIGSTVYVGSGGRTNTDGIEQLGRYLGDAWRHVIPVPLTRCAAPEVSGHGAARRNPSRPS